MREPDQIDMMGEDELRSELRQALSRLDGAIYLLHCLKESIPGIEHDDLHKRVLLFLDGVVEKQRKISDG